MPPTTDDDSPHARAFARPPRPTPAALALLLLAGCATTESAPPTDERLAFLLTKYDRDGDGRVARSEYDRAPTGFARLDRDGDGFVGATDFALPPPPPPPGLGGPYLFVRAFGPRGADAVSAEEAPRRLRRRRRRRRRPRDAGRTRGRRRAGGGGRAPAGGRRRPRRRARRRRNRGPMSGRATATATPRSRAANATVPGREPPVGRFPPGLREPAPDFALRRLDGAGAVRLADLRGRPVALIFGSFT
jgi:hypothetical protein